MSHNLIPIFYLISGILFILALRGLSSPETSRKGNFYGVVGMVIAIVTTLIVIKIPFSSVTTWSMLIAGIFIGGTIGTIIAQRIAMTAMPQLVAGFLDQLLFHGGPWQLLQSRSFLVALVQLLRV